MTNTYRTVLRAAYVSGPLRITFVDSEDHRSAFLAHYATDYLREFHEGLQRWEQTFDAKGNARVWSSHRTIARQEGVRLYKSEAEAVAAVRRVEPFVVCSFSRMEPIAGPFTAATTSEAWEDFLAAGGSDEESDDLCTIPVAAVPAWTAEVREEAAEWSFVESTWPAMEAMLRGVPDAPGCRI